MENKQFTEEDKIGEIYDCLTSSLINLCEKRGIGYFSNGDIIDAVRYFVIAILGSMDKTDEGLKILLQNFLSDKVLKDNLPIFKEFIETLEKKP